MENRTARSRLFNDVADDYERIRPGYPNALYEDVISYSGIPPEGRVLEIGCGPGTASVELARRGFSLECVELGPSMAALARSRLAGFPNARVECCNFESWESASGFDLIVSASAFHWIAPELRWRKTAQLLRPSGTLAVCWNRHVRVPEDRGFFDAVQEVYEAIAPEAARKSPLPESVPMPEGQELAGSGLFTEIETRTYPWLRRYSAREYVQLLNTHSDHLALSMDRRQRLYPAVVRMIDERFGGEIVKGYLTVLHIGRKLNHGR